MTGIVKPYVVPLTSFFPVTLHCSSEFKKFKELYRLFDILCGVGLFAQSSIINPVAKSSCSQCSCDIFPSLPDSMINMETT